MFLDRIEDSPSLELVNLILRMKAEGEKIVSLGVGDPVFDTPREIVEVAYKSMLQEDTHYVPSSGTPDVREAIRVKVARKNGIRAEVENTLFMAAKMAVYVALSSISNGPFEALMPDPGSFYSFPKYRGRLKSQALCMRLLETRKVALLPGAIFGPAGEHHLRICFASSEQTIRAAMAGARKFFAENRA